MDGFLTSSSEAVIWYSAQWKGLVEGLYIIISWVIGELLLSSSPYQIILKKGILEMLLDSYTWEISGQANFLACFHENILENSHSLDTSLVCE